MNDFWEGFLYAFDEDYWVNKSKITENKIWLEFAKRAKIARWVVWILGPTILFYLTFMIF